jgi:hypothetical protein
MAQTALDALVDPTRRQMLRFLAESDEAAAGESPNRSAPSGGRLLRAIFVSCAPQPWSMSDATTASPPIPAR